VTKLRADAPIEKGTASCEQYAGLAYKLDAIEARRTRNIGTINALCDRAAAPILAEMQMLEEQLKPWWLRIVDKVTEGKRKSAELGGCMIGTKDKAASLAIDGDEAAIVEQLKGQRWAKGYLRTTVSIDKVAVLKAVAATNPHAQKLTAAGFSKTSPEPTFFVKRVVQGGTVSSR
jgi:hypothetical protein